MVEEVQEALSAYWQQVLSGAFTQTFTQSLLILIILADGNNVDRYFNFGKISYDGSRSPFGWQSRFQGQVRLDPYLRFQIHHPPG